MLQKCSIFAAKIPTTLILKLRHFFSHKRRKLFEKNVANTPLSRGRRGYLFLGLKKTARFYGVRYRTP